MSKLLGALLVLAGGLIWALLCVETGRKRMECLTQLASDLERLSCELDTGDRPLPELIHMLSENGGVQSRDFFVRLENSLWRMGDVEFRSLWREAAERCSVPLNRTERYALGNLGAFLGRYSRQRQTEAIAECGKLLKKSAQEMRDQWPNRTRLSFGLGAGGALMIVLALL